MRINSIMASYLSTKLPFSDSKNDHDKPIQQTISTQTMPDLAEMNMPIVSKELVAV